MGKIKIERIKGIAHIQDFGRIGYRKFGIPYAGAMDFPSMTWANRQVGNPEHFPVIEYALAELNIVAVSDTTIAIAGSLSKIYLNGHKTEKKLLYLKDNDHLKIAHSTAGVYGYLAIKGLLIAQKHLGSYATYPPARLGGLNGFPLKCNDMIETKAREEKKYANSKPLLHLTAKTQKIRIIPGPEWHLLMEMPDQQIWTISPQSNRVGIRLENNILKANSSEILSSAVVPGTIQLPPSGKPIVLMNDCSTTGGYPRIGKVVAEDMHKLAQIQPGHTLQFTIYNITLFKHYTLDVF